MQYGLLGEHLPHSHSPKIHSLLGNSQYTLFEKGADEVYDFLKERKFQGINVTIPYKKTVMPLCDVLDGAAIEIGAVNTVVNCNGTLFGCNTDFDGFIFMCNRANIAFKGKKVLILGTGGTSHTAFAAAKKLGAAEIVSVSRKGEINYENVYEKAEDAEIIINTTPVGMYPNIGEKPIELSRFAKLSGVVDVIYNPLRTRLVCEAKSLGIPATGGLTMLVAQAAFADKYFRGVTHSGGEIVNLTNRMHTSVENIVLIGMPGCGKSTAGKIAAKQLGREFFDIDKLIVEREGMQIPDIFEKHGEDYFRNVESEVTKEVSAKGGVVIACGGGTVLREENRISLCQNGKVFYIKRNLENLAKSGRPLSQGVGALEKLYEVRKPIYEGFADVTIDPCKTVEECVARIIGDFKK
ncbi:MAG: AAA family ATPase [Ruminococcaceae bacterium]|nr:AAA family ATPase [Oscillospiraceae bacterium]